MKDNILSINLETQTAPVVSEVRGKDYIEYGTEDWRNLYPQFLIDLYYNSSTHAAIVNSTAEMIAGEDLIVEDDDTNLDAYVKLKKFLRHANSKESLHQVIKKVAFDFKLQGAYALHIIWNRERTEIAEIYHVPVERVRAGRPNEMGQVDTYFISGDWSNVRTHKPYAISAFNVNDRTAGSQLLYTGAYSPNMDIYHTPDYIAGCNWALVDQRVAEFHLSNIENGFSGSYFISFANGIPTQEERFQIEQSLTEKFTGAKNSGKFILTFSDDKTRTPEITPISVSDADKQYLALQELLVQNICSAHRVTSKTLLGIDSTNGFSSNTDELVNAANFYQNTVVRGFQLNILNTLQTIFSVNNMDLPVEFVQLKHITVQFDSETIREVMTQDEIREDIGLAPLSNDEEVVDDRDNFSKVGNIDGKPVFDTIEEAEAHAKTIGCEGYHEHEYEGKVSYMACKDHSEATELSKFIAEFGEDMPEEWELVEEEKADGEHTDFDFEEVLNDVANEKIELASTGRAIPSRKSEQDGVSKKTYDYFRVRYVYTKDNFLSQEGETRDFCRQMMGVKKVYRKEDIINMSKRPVNPGWGPRGANTYSIWLYKGGGNCHHYWLRQIYKTTIGESKTTKIEDADLIGYTKAKSEGFTAKKNNVLVAKPPKKMKNNGFLEPR
ncbi:MAG: phage portal protein [Gammaproteobacteria bacterium]|nr:phage portal protein [Gammaproteobacteria bacterium]